MNVARDEDAQFLGFYRCTGEYEVATGQGFRVDASICFLETPVAWILYCTVRYGTIGMMMRRPVDLDTVTRDACELRKRK